MHREEAKEILRELSFKKLTKEGRFNALEELFITCDEEDWFDKEDLEYYSKEIRDELLANEEPPNPEDPKYDYIIKDDMKGMFYGVTNDYLKELLSKENIQVSNITGTNDFLEPCPCCRYRTISPGEDGMCEICPVCFWENFGDGPNHMTLKQAQENFKQYGAMNKEALKFISLDRMKMYESPS